MSTSRAAPMAIRHVRPARPLRFPEQEPESERMGQGQRHHRLCEALYEMLRAACDDEHTVGADQFVYFDAANPKRCLAPDAFVKLGVPHAFVETYLAWEKGAPELAFEILSPSDTPERWRFAEKLRRYRALGVRELIVLNLDAPPGRRLRAWDRVEHDLVERVVEGERTPCLTLGLRLLVGPVRMDAEFPFGLRLSRDPEGRDFLLTSVERSLREAEGRRQAEAERAAEAEGRRREEQARRQAEAERAAEAEGRRREEEARRRAEERVAELERELADRRDRKPS